MSAPPDFSDSLERLHGLTGLAADWIERALSATPNPERALSGLERWFAACANPGTLAFQLRDAPPLASRLILVLGASRHLTDILVQNPELSELLFEAEPPMPARSKVAEEAMRLAEGASSYSHRLDRLRYLKQRWTLRIALADMGGLWLAEAVWTALSEVALGLIRAARDIAWVQFAVDRFGNSSVACPIDIIAMGKLGGVELNYSSDVDLVYVLDDAIDEQTERDALRFCEVLGRALADRMGRGALYRVDLRLRPFGASGPIAARRRAVEAYYRNYAEPWEQLALIRSQSVLDDGGWWEELRQEVCFKAARGEWVVEELLEMRDRIEEHSEADDLKRGAGGIRDVEFLVQILQMLGGAGRPSLRSPGTLPALRAIASAELLDPDGEQKAVWLGEAYTFLRQVEHRCQILDDRQTHRLPRDPGDLRLVADSVGCRDAAELVTRLAEVRTRVRTQYDEILRVRRPKAEVATPGEARMGQLDRLAPALAAMVREDETLVEQVLSGEIEEIIDPAARLAEGADPSVRTLAGAVRRMWLAWAIQRLLDSPTFGLAELFDAALFRLTDDARTRISVVALGSYAAADLGFRSDADVLIVTREGVDQAVGERAAESLLAAVREAHAFGSPMSLDLRLRPEGGKGLLAPTIAGLRAYDRESLEVWERLALSRARLVFGEGCLMDELRAIVFRQPLDRLGFEELIAMKRRIETERVRPEEADRDLKLGRGGLDDLDWMTKLGVLALGAEKAGPTFAGRVEANVLGGLLDSVDAEFLLMAKRFLDDLRFGLAMVGFAILPTIDATSDWDRLAAIEGLSTGALVEKHQEIRARVRRLFGEATARIQAMLP